LKIFQTEGSTRSPLGNKTEKNKNAQKIILPLIYQKLSEKDNDNSININVYIDNNFNEKENIERFNHINRQENYKVLFTK